MSPLELVSCSAQPPRPIVPDTALPPIDPDAVIKDAEAAFEQQATGRDEQDARHGDRIDPDQGRSAYQDDES